MNNMETSAQHPLSSRLSESGIPQLCDQSIGLAEDVQAPAQPQEQEQSTPLPPILRLPEDILLYIASPRFLSLNDIVQWRATASVFHQSIPLPHAAMVRCASMLLFVCFDRSDCAPAQPQTPKPKPPNQTKKKGPNTKSTPPLSDINLDLAGCTSLSGQATAGASPA
jgi:hypothetical protein